jgi:hypothetical protein
MQARDYWGIIGGLLALAFLDLGAWMCAHLGKSGSPRHAEHLLIGISGTEIILLGVLGLAIALCALLGGDPR